ncbi:glycosyltransferase family 2 protein [Candidatus Omnitrophota bacterium]
MTFSLIMLCLNEIECLKVILPRIKKEWVDEIIIVDGHSTDGSIEYARALGFDVLLQKEKGPIAGYQEAIEKAKGDVVITFTPDGNMIPEKIPELVEKMREGYDMVIVSRYAPGAKSYDDTAISGFGNWMFTKMVNVLFRAKYTDVLGFYRAFRKDLFQRLGLEGNIRISVDTQLCIRCAKKRLKVAEIPGDEPPRISGRSYRSIIKNGCLELFTIVEERFTRSS